MPSGTTILLTLLLLATLGVFIANYAGAFLLPGQCDTTCGACKNADSDDDNSAEDRENLRLY